MINILFKYILSMPLFFVISIARQCTRLRRIRPRGQALGRKMKGRYLESAQIWLPMKYLIHVYSVGTWEPLR
jgi:hypothetical protein